MIPADPASPPHAGRPAPFSRPMHGHLLHRLPLLLLLACLSAPMARAGGGDSTSIDLRGLAAFRPGDDDVWRSPTIDEREDWHFITIPGCWERQGFAMLDGFAWYRVRFRIPQAMRNDSLVLVMSGVDDADETFLNGILVGRSGSLPPAPRSELRSLRIYPLPRHIRQEYNALALRVYDMGDSGGVTGGIFRIIRVDSIPRLLDEVVNEPFRAPQLITSNGVLVSAFDPGTLTLEWTRPTLYAMLDTGRRSENILAALRVLLDNGGPPRALRDLGVESAGWEPGTTIIHARLRGGAESWWFHPHSTQSRILVCAVRLPAGMHGTDAGLDVNLLKSSWQVEQRDELSDSGMTRYFILACNSCCEEIARRDLDEFLTSPTVDGHAPHTVEAERSWWQAFRQRLQIPSWLTPEQRGVYVQSCVLLAASQVGRFGLGHGQILSALAPESRAITIPRDHLNACIALARAGAVEEAEEGIAFIENAATGAYRFYHPFGHEAGTILPYLVTPARYTGSGAEQLWQRRDEAVLSFDGTALYVEAVDALRQALRERSLRRGAVPDDGAVVAAHWANVSTLSADLLLELVDSTGLIGRDGGPWGQGLATTPNIATTIHAIRALRIAASHATLMNNTVKALVYTQGADAMRHAVQRCLRAAMHADTEAAIPPFVRAAFHPLAADALTCGVLSPGSPEAAAALDVVETGFAISDAPGGFNARPEGDWFARQARPFIALRLARAHAANGDATRARSLLDAVTRIAAPNHGMLPELIDPVSGNWYGGWPMTGMGAAEYINACWDIHP